MFYAFNAVKLFLTIAVAVQHRIYVSIAAAAMQEWLSVLTYSTGMAGVPFRIGTVYIVPKSP